MGDFSQYDHYAATIMPFERIKFPNTLLNFETSESALAQLLTAINKIQYASNTNSFFDFYFPIVSHILHFKPQAETDLLRYIIGPNFANGITGTKAMIQMIVAAMHFVLKENLHYLTTEGKAWVQNELPKLEKQVEREIQICWKELEE